MMMVMMMMMMVMMIMMDDDDDDGVTREKILEPQARHRPTPCGVQLSNLSKAGDVYFGFIRLSLSLSFMALKPV
jgi:hypothetical protein